MDYAGNIEVSEVWRRLSEDPNAVLIDVRTEAEWNYVGLPDLSSLGKQVLRIEWQFFPSAERNMDFQAQVEGSGIAKDAPIYLLCRSGVRSKNAAILLTAADFETCYNVAGGFEGDKGESGHRGTLGGWKFAGLPWVQG
ncbi:MAG: rhodanese-like domain-containing protein [Rhodospirillaceae bacterium]|jgi:rhodanese-related sulfurtransferase|nr:rhodanese-like domain-containing protein [Rhodospirillaceae bacterium]MBT3492647.1 rhodanese-like domain-containing protein [Rhodospirillaceae bacterium]MBT3779658.1 rhodanese-like domain-containing protein [Rhodospirillaceae bacterium]MBT3975951.1 rhodanese-like domain-containing protein [Rhodospirillaceae bacterium]MBT4170612.1 rhodanese-like domain-containing protein [Rhodospirillaceae bacterium]